ncbi:2S sulfur-rich seed storage protein large chain 1B like [Actinidia chinensis var. chinensis]|uniref:2S sulfur-rich seed storage protein large chain 1B like n=1 Tax=Actinidia chinensis var. chinensis TaxID=1590841 RepID=A0A2R6QDF4_ACTCC|nr:2S sulfur-rich seed storage protein large chain 1B like [Actinidia chinensis var. chinensis]
MVKLTILAAAFVALLALASVSSHRTTITTTVVEEEENPGQQQQCREQIQSQQNLRHCQMYLAQVGRDYYDVAMVTDRNPQQQQHLRECCQQLQKIDEECRCEGVRMAVRQQQGQREREEMGQIMQMAQDLPSKCNLSPRRCQIQASWF